MGGDEGVVFHTDALCAWAKLLVVFMIYFSAAKNLKTGHSWVDTLLLFGLTFAIGGAGFLFAPNRAFFFAWKAGEGVVKGCFMRFGWDYLAYAVVGFLSRYLLNIYDGEDFKWTLPEV